MAIHHVLFLTDEPNSLTVSLIADTVLKIGLKARIVNFDTRHLFLSNEWHGVILMISGTRALPTSLPKMPFPTLLVCREKDISRTYQWLAQLNPNVLAQMLVIDDNELYTLNLERILNQLFIQPTLHEVVSRTNYIEEIEALKSQTELALRAKDEFLANMSHNLRNPLNGIMGNSQILLQEIYGNLTERQRKSVQAIETSGQNLLSLINDVLDLAQVEVGIIKLNLSAVKLANLCHYVVSLVHPMIDRKRQHLELTLDPKVGEIACDEKRIRQVLLNLMTNAIKFTPEGGRVGLVMRGNTAEREIELTVWDTGIGIPDEFLPSLFEPFVQIDSSLSKRFDGIGLGLALALRMVKLHDGDITVESNVDAGSRFTAHIPWRLPAQVTETPPKTEELRTILNHPVTNPLAKRYKILIAEDNELNRETFRDFVEYAGYRALVAKDGQELLDIAQIELPSLIMMDIQMPKVNGLDAIRFLRSQPSTRDIPIMVLTGYAMNSDRELVMRMGASEYLSKPVQLQDLLVKLRKFCPVE